MSKKQLKLIPLAGIIYFTVSGGAFGLENVFSSSGPGLGLVLLIVTPLLWSLPIAFVTAEMSTMLPIDGGYYRWVYFAMGRFWGFQEGWWTWLYTFVDMAIYPVTFSIYLRFFFPGMTGWQQWLVNLSVIAVSVAVNWRGARSVGSSAVAAFIVVTVAFLLLAFLAAPKAGHWPWMPFKPADGKSVIDTLGLGISAVMWSYMGWDNVSTFAGEVENPGRTFPRALMLSVFLVTVLYLIPMGFTLAATQDWQTWDSDTHTISQIASGLVGPWLGAVIAFSVMFSNWSLFNSQLLYTSRLPYAMAEDGLLPSFLAKRHSKYGTPVYALILCSLIYGAFTALNFKKLVIIDVLVYSISLLLELAALIWLRVRRPELARPYKIAGGKLGLGLVTLSLTGSIGASIVLTLLSESDWKQLVIAGGMLMTGPLVYALFIWYPRRLRPVHPAPEWIQAYKTNSGN